MRDIDRPDVIPVNHPTVQSTDGVMITCYREGNYFIGQPCSINSIQSTEHRDPDQIGLVATDNRTKANHRYKFRAIGASSTGLRSSFAVRTVSDWNQLPAIVVEQENPAAFTAQLARCSPVRMP